MVEIQNLTKYYGSKAALKGISFTIKENEVLGFLGPNGAGKSTTLNIMAGVIPSTGGTVKIQGYDIAQQPVKAKKCIGFLPEIPPVYPDMKVREYLHFAAGLKGIPAVKRKSEVERVMERLKITDVQKRLIRNLSKGYKQRVGFAMAILGDPPVLILDEPTSILATRTVEALQAGLQHLLKGRTSFIIAHRLSTIVDADLILVRDHGNIIEQGTHKELLAAEGANADQLADILLGDSDAGYFGQAQDWDSGSNSTCYAFPTAKWKDEPYKQAYNNVMSSWNILRQKVDSASVVFALGEVVKVQAMHRVTDIYGPLPYTAFGKMSSGLPYDSQETVYRPFIKELDPDAFFIVCDASEVLGEGFGEYDPQGL